MNALKNFSLGSIWMVSILLSLPIWGQNGLIKGRILDAKNSQPIMGASVGIPSLGLGGISNLEGEYEIANLEPGFYTLTVSYLGYESQTKSEIQVTNSRPANIDFFLEEESEAVEEVVVKASPFKQKAESPTSLQTIGTAEIQRNPGGNRDISKVIRILPGVTTTNSFRNDLIIRGGAPNENRFFLDDIEVPNINHYATQGASGGPQGLLNVDLISEVDFFSGAFPANRGNSLSSVFNFRQKNARDDRLGLTASVGATDVSLALEGPLDKNKNHSLLLSARQSYLQFLFDAIGLSFLPTYNDFQFKWQYKLPNKDLFYVTGLGAIDRFKLNLDANETPEQRYQLDNIPVNNQWNYAIGAVYKKFQKNGYYTFVLSRNMLNNDIFKHEENDESLPRTFDYNSQESENKLRLEHSLRLKGDYKLSYGLGYQYVRYFNRSNLQALLGGSPQLVSYQSELFFHKYAAFGQISKRFLQDRLNLSVGMRLDGNSYSELMANPLEQFSPRLALSYAITPQISFNANAGIFYQLPAYTALGFRSNDGSLANQDRLKFIRNQQLVAGFSYLSETASKISVEAYYKKYDNYPFLLNEQIALANFGADFGVVGAAPLDDRGEGRSYGLEFLFQQRLYKGFYGILAYTLGRSEFKNQAGDYVVSSWDSRHIVNAALGKTIPMMNQKIRKARNEKREAKGKSAITKTLVNQELQLGLNIRMQTGLPYTPYNDSLSALVQNWNSFNEGLRDYSQLNSERTNLFYGVDFRVDYKWYFPKWSLQLYFDLQNFPSQAASQPRLILEQGDDGNQPVTIINEGQPDAAYLLRSIDNTSSVTVPSIGVIIQY